MRKIIYASAIFTSMMMASCSGTSSNDLKQAQNFAMDVANKMSKNQKDLVVAVYPDAEKVDSFVTSFVVDSVKVLPTDSETIFTADLGSGKEFTIQKLGEDSLVVTKSRGLFAYAAVDLEYGKKTGMYADSLSDIQNLERMSEKNALHQYLMDSFEVPQGLKVVDTSYAYKYVVKNTSNMHISGKDYKLVAKHWDAWTMGEVTYTKAGRDLAPGASTTYTLDCPPGDRGGRASIVYTSSKETQFEKYYVYKGDEYDRFIKAKGKN